MSEQTARPKVTRVYQNHPIDSTRWRVFKPRPSHDLSVFADMRFSPLDELK